MALTDNFHLNMSEALTVHLQQHRSRTRQIEDPTVHIGATIGNADMDVLSIGQIDDPNGAPERDGSVGRGQSFHVKDFTVGGQPPMKLLAVPGGNPSVLDTDIKLGIAFRNPGTGSQQHSCAYGYGQ